MVLLNWTPFIFSRKGFPRDDEGKPFIPSNILEGALKSAAIYYFIKKDREIENKVKNYLLKKNINPRDVINEVRNIVFAKYPIFDNLKIAEKLYLDEKSIKEQYIEIFDLKKWIDIDGFKTEVYQGEINVPINLTDLEKIRAICLSYIEGLAHIEKSMVKDHPLENFYNELLSEVKNWDIPLRIGMWTENQYRGSLLYFWRIKEIREKFLKEHKIDIRPRYILYIPRENKTTGWSELKIK